MFFDVKYPCQRQADNKKSEIFVKHCSSKHFLIRYFSFLLFLRFANTYLEVHGHNHRQALFVINMFIQILNYYSILTILFHS